MTSTPDGPLLICYDGSDDAKHAIRSAAALLAPRRALVVAVWEPIGAFDSFGFAGETATTVDFVELNRASAEHCAGMANEGADIARAARLEADPVAIEATGPIWKTLIETAERHDAVAIVMGSRGLTRVRSFLLGSVSNAVVHHSDRPALVIRRPNRHAA
jgi:nucleotide-binding universal stress UspA family protein